MTTIKSILVRLENLHQTLWVSSGKQHAATLAEFNREVAKANKLLRAEKMPDGSPVHTRDLSGYELLSLNEYISA
jgi:hypothetical protein